jgi:hypothetical protein
MVAVRGDLYALEPNHGELDKITTDGQVSRVVDISASQGHIVPTALAVREKAEKPEKKEKKDRTEKKAANHGNFYVGNLNTFPIEEGSSKIYKITPSGQIEIVAEGLTTVLGAAFDARGRMYALENTTGNPFPTPGTGRVLRVHRSGALEIIASGLDLPTAMTFGPDGNLYVSNWGFGPPVTDIGPGQVLKIELTDRWHGEHSQFSR